MVQVIIREDIPLMVDLSPGPLLCTTSLAGNATPLSSPLVLILCSSYGLLPLLHIVILMFSLRNSVDTVVDLMPDRRPVALGPAYLGRRL
jgi:hypothetical protein